MEPHMIEDYIHYVFAYEINHVGFIVKRICQSEENSSFTLLIKLISI